MEFGWVGCDFIAEDTDFDFVGVRIDCNGPGIEERLRLDRVEEDWWRARPKRCEGQGMRDSIIVYVEGVGDVQQ